MGKRKLQGAKLRAHKRSKAQVEELQEHQAAEYVNRIASEQLVSSFIIDTVGENVPHGQKPAAKAKSRNNDEDGAAKNKHSAKEQLQINRFLQKHKNDMTKIQEIVQNGRSVLDQSKHSSKMIRTSGKKIRMNDKKKTNYDLWEPPGGEAPKEISSTTTATTTDPGIGGSLAGISPHHSIVKALPYDVAMLQKKQKKRGMDTTTTTNSSAVVAAAGVAIDVALTAGQSYCPDPVAHNALLVKATEAELLRENATRILKTPIATGMSLETRELLVGDSDTSDDDEDNDDNDETDVALTKRTNSKLTRAQRNKQKRIRQEQIDILKRRAEKKLLKQAGNIHRLTKDIKVTEAMKLQEREQLQHKKDVTKPIPGKHIELRAFQLDPIAAPTIPIVLPRDNNNNNAVSLRTIQPKGSLITDRIQSYTDRQFIGNSKKKGKKVKTTAASLSAHDGLQYDPLTTQPKKSVYKKRKKSLKGKHNQDWKGTNFEILGC